MPTKNSKNTSSELRKLVKEIPKVFLDPLIHELNEHPKNVKVHFIDAQWMQAFEPFISHPDRTIKFVNWGKAAINLTFFEKHKYIVHKEPDIADIEAHLRNKIEVLHIEATQTNLFENDYIEKKRAANFEEIRRIQEVLEKLPDYQFALSNYYRNYTYWYVNWRWIKEDGSHDYGQEHLLKDETDYSTNLVTRKENIIFVDMERISEHTPYQSKKVEEFLNSFTQRVDIGTHDIFIKQKSADVD